MTLDYSTEAVALFSDAVYETPEYSWFLEEIAMLPQDSPRNLVRLFRDMRTVNALRMSVPAVRQAVVKAGGGMRGSSAPEVAQAVGATAEDALVTIVAEFDARALTRDGARIVTEHLRQRIRSEVCGLAGADAMQCASPVDYGFDLDAALAAVDVKAHLPAPEVIELTRSPSLLGRLFG
ncbi:MAG: hypothetical protein AAGA87_13800 [Pseudomonadota bacterium]